MSDIDKAPTTSITRHLTVDELTFERVLGVPCSFKATCVASDDGATRLSFYPGIEMSKLLANLGSKIIVTIEVQS